MIWKETSNPRVWEAAWCIASAVDNTIGREGGYIAHIYERHPVRLVEGTARWGGTIAAALRGAVLAFDQDATLPRGST